MKYLFSTALVALLAACGGGSSDRYDAGQVSRFSSGPISRACMSSDRKARNTQLCGCIQSVANVSLSGSDQSMAVSFFEDPHRAQEIRQSDNSGHERFWLRYKGFVAMAESNCRSYS